MNEAAHAHSKWGGGGEGKQFFTHQYLETSCSILHISKVCASVRHTYQIPQKFQRIWYLDMVKSRYMGIHRLQTVCLLDPVPSNTNDKTKWKAS